jgi:hypothetical protein
MKKKDEMEPATIMILKMVWVLVEQASFMLANITTRA